MAITAQDVANYLQANPGLSDAQIAAAMDQYGVSPATVAQATGLSTADVQSRYEAAGGGGGGMLSTPAPAQPSEAAQPAGVPADVKAAMESKNLTQAQYNTLASYFGNDMVLNEATRDPNKPTIKDFVGKRSGYEFASFLASRGTEQGAIGTEAQKFQSLVEPYIGQEVSYRVDTDNETGQQRYFVNDPATGKETEVFRQADGTYKGFTGNLSGQEQGSMSEGSFNLGISYNFDPETGKATIGAPTIKYQAPQSGLGMLGSVAALGLGVAFPGLGTVLGTSLGLTGAAASAVGSALIGGLTTGAITGDLEKGLIAGALSGLGAYGVESGMIGDAFDALNLGEYKDTFGLKNSTQIANLGDVESQLGGFYGNTPTATYNPQTGLTGLADGRVVAEAGNPAGIPAGTYTQEQFVNQLQQTFPEAKGLITGAVSDNLGGGIKLPTGAGDMLGVSGAVTAPAGGAAGGTGLTPGAAGITGIGGATAGGLLSGAATGASVANTISDLLGNTSVQNLLGAGIDYARLNELQNLANQQAQSVRQEATAAGQLANIPFTPYTVTSGAGTTAFGTNAAGQPTATVTSSPEYEALRQQALTQAGQAYGAINPATATQDYYANLQALQAPGQQIAQEQLLSNLASKGLLGIGRNVPTVGQTGTSAVNPYIQSLLASQRQADLQNAIASQQYGLQQAQGQANLAGALLGQGQNIDTAALQTLSQGAGLGATATQLNQAGAARQLGATLAGQEIGSKYDIAALNAQAQALSGAGGALKGLLGLPTTAGNTGSSNLVQQGINYLGGLFS